MNDLVEWLAIMRASMRSSGIPTELADTMIRDAHWLHVCRGLWPDQPPSYQTRIEDIESRITKLDDILATLARSEASAEKIHELLRTLQHGEVRP